MTNAVDPTYLEVVYLERRFISNQILFPMDLAPYISVICHCLFGTRFSRTRHFSFFPSIIQASLKIYR